MNYEEIKNKNVEEMELDELKKAVSFLIGEAGKIEQIKEEIKGRWSTDMISIHRVHQILKTYE